MYDNIADIFQSFEPNDHMMDNKISEEIKEGGINLGRD